MKFGHPVPVGGSDDPGDIVIGRPLPGARPPSSKFGPQTALGFPQRTTFESTLPGIKQALGPAQQLAPVAALEKVSALPGFGQDFFDELFRKSKSRLTSEFFGDQGLQQQQTENLAARGLLGSSIEGTSRGRLGEQFGQRLADVQGDIAKVQAEQGLEEARERRRLNQEIGVEQSRQDQARAIENARFESALQELGIRSALTEAKDQNVFGIGRFGEEVKLRDIQAQNENARQQRILDFIGNPEVDISDDEAQRLIDTLILG
jgi:hypothetical protein